MVQLPKIIILLNTTSVLVFLTDVVSSITTSDIKPTSDSTSPGSTSGRKIDEKSLLEPTTKAIFLLVAV